MKTNTNIFIISVIICALSAHNVFAQQDAGEEIALKIMNNPKNIREYNIQYLLELPIESQIKINQTILSGIPESQISRNDMKKYYIPIILSNIDSLLEIHPTLLLMSNDRISSVSDLLKKNDSLIGVETSNMFKYTKRVYMALCNIILYEDISKIPKNYCGNFRFVERELFLSDSISNIFFPIPDTLLEKINTFIHLNRNDIALPDSIIMQANQMYHNGQCDVIFNHYKELLQIASYIDASLLSEYLSHIEKCITQNDANVDVLQIFKDGYLHDKESGTNQMSSMIVLYAKNMMRLRDTLRGFYQYRDELYNRYHYEYAKYSPYKCPEKYRTPQGPFSEYLKRFTNVLVTAANCGLFTNPLVQDEITKILQSTYNMSALWSDVLHEAYFAWTSTGDDNVLTIIEHCVSYLDGGSTIITSANDIFMIADIYSGFNPYKMRNILDKYCLPVMEHNIDKYKNGQNDPEDDFVLAWNLSHLAYYYSILKNPYRKRTIIEYLDIVRGLDVSKKDPLYCDILLLCAEAYMNTGDYERVDKIIRTIKCQVRDIQTRKRYIEMQNAFYSDNEKKLYDICKKLDTSHLSPADCAKCFFASLSNNDHVSADEFATAFSRNIGEVFSELEILNAGDREICQKMKKREVEYPFYNSWLDLSVQEIIGDSASCFRDMFASMVYDYCLSFKGSVLQANTSIKERVRIDMADEFRIMDSINQLQKKEIGDSSFVNNYFKKLSDLYLYGEIRRLHGSGTDINYKDVSSRLSERSATVELMQLDEGIYLVTILRKDWKHPIVFDIYLREKKYDSIDNFASLFSDSVWLREMYTKVWGPIEKYVDVGDTIFFSMDGIFDLMAVEQFLDDNLKSASDKYCLWRVSSTAKIPQDVFVSSLNKAAVFGNLNYFMNSFGSEYVDYYDVYGTDVFENCPPPRGNLYTEDEIQRITNILNTTNTVEVVPFLGEKGTEKQFKKVSEIKPDIIHLATHGFYCKDRGMNVSAMERAGIVLSGSDEIPIEDDGAGLLFASEIADMNLSSVKLLVLSACNTGLGENSDDGIYGIHRGFMQAGVGSIIMTLWPVNNNVATEFMSLFYSGFAQGKSLHSAFTDAQLNMKKKYKNNNWMTFVLLN